MTFEEILASCIAQLEAGDTVENCLARYPAEAAELEPLLRVVAAMRNTPAPAMPEESFARGRSAIAAAVKRGARPPLRRTIAGCSRLSAGCAASDGSANAALRAAVCLADVGRRPDCGLSASGYRGRRADAGRAPRRGALGALYEVKLLGEEAQGLLMAAAGNEAEWHAAGATALGRVGAAARPRSTHKAGTGGAAAGRGAGRPGVERRPAGCGAPRCWTICAGNWPQPATCRAKTPAWRRCNRRRMPSPPRCRRRPRSPRFCPRQRRFRLQPRRLRRRLCLRTRSSARLRPRSRKPSLCCPRRRRFPRPRSAAEPPAVQAAEPALPTERPQRPDRGRAGRGCAG